MDLPAHLLEGTFESFLKRGAIIRFWVAPEDLKDNNWPDGKPKYAVVLNVNCAEAEILYVFTTSQDHPAFKRFEHVLIRVPVGTYDCFTLDTIISFREIGMVRLEKLQQQYGEKKMTFCGTLSPAHVEHMDTIIKISQSPNVKRRILPQ